MPPVPPIDRPSVPSLFPSQLVLEQTVLQDLLRHFRQQGLPYKASGVSRLTFAIVRAALRLGHRLIEGRLLCMLPDHLGRLPALGFLALTENGLNARPGAALFSMPLCRLVLDEVFTDDQGTAVRPIYQSVVTSEQRIEIEELAEVVVQSPDLAYRLDLLASLAEQGTPMWSEAAERALRAGVDARHPEAHRSVRTSRLSVRPEDFS
ncbi:hypothetical protein [Deinococcus aquatilis]|uniref:hypothetical protein n=1 Tax=Deinococcus aquatilis TaxID=519440 RepID=UPI0012FC105F|nr:hypothetical protein [Deinococcus aquatilis]